MRKPRDLDAELEALAQRAKALKSRRVVQFGDLVIATGADALELDMLAGALLAAVSASQPEHSAWQAKGAAFFRRERTNSRTKARRGPASDGGGPTPPAGDDPAA